MRSLNKNILQETLVEKRYTNTLRKSIAKHLLDSGKINLSCGQDFLRHTRITTTEDALKSPKKA